MLCLECENKFSKYESYFNREIFRPFVSGKQTVFKYDDRLNRFVLSVLWRLLEAGEIIDEAKPTDKPILIESKRQIARFLRGDLSESFQLQMLAGVDLFKHEPTVELPDGAIYYVARVIDFSILSGDGKLYLYLKLPRFVFILPLKGFNVMGYRSSEVSHLGGIFNVESTRISDQVLADFIWETFTEISRLKAEMTSTQQELSRKVGKEKWSELKTKDLGVILDYQQRKSIQNK